MVLAILGLSNPVSEALVNKYLIDGICLFFSIEYYV